MDFEHLTDRHPGINRGCFQFLVAEQLLDKPDFLAAFEHVRCAGTAYLGLIAKESYWRWPERNLSGNTIDFFCQILGLSFHDAMTEIMAS
jgi:hypothetical protein